MAKRKSNWSIIKKQKPTDTLRNRDVYEDQQLERGSLAEKETMTSRVLLDLAISGITFLLIWMLISLILMFFSGGGKLEFSDNPAHTWLYVNEHYENVNDGSDKISTDEYNTLEQVYKNSASAEVVEQPVEPEKPDTNSYMFERGGYMIPNQPDTWISIEEYEGLNNAYEEALVQYKDDLAKYKAYQKATTDPSTTYQFVIGHYRNRNDFSQAIREEEYEELMESYNKRLSKGKVTADEQDVPMLPYDPSSLWIADSYGTIEKEIVDENGVPTGEIEAVQGPVTYRHTLDGSTISYVDYDELVNKYNQDVSAYKTAYANHRNLYHPNDPDGTKKTFSMAPTKVKFGISFSIAAILFSVLLVLFKRNLDAANLLSDTKDINQYHNDQHVALPEEVQRGYDWFPNVGAHSGVQVSSMLSHMALSNKGLKKIEFAQRASKDIKDDEGNVEYFKGDILNDEDGNPITDVVPLIDEEFMEDLFEASGVPDDKAIRKRYDATKIPYNPDGKNRDKLGKFETVADLINEDWEFPIYEPQRPGGAYIVDTAPVNTMV